MNKQTLLYTIKLIIGVLLFCTFEVVSKSMNGALNASQLTFYRFLIGGIILIPFGLRDLRQRNLRYTPKMFFTFLGTGFLLVTVSMTLCQVGLTYTTASITAVLFSSNPLFVSLFSNLLLKERLTFFKILGLFIGIAGLVAACSNVLFSPTVFSFKFFMGLVLILIAMLVFSFYTVINKRLTKKYGSFTCLSSSSILGCIPLIPVVLYLGRQEGISPFAFDLSGVLFQFLFISIFITGIGYYCYFDATSHLDTGISSMTFFVKPPLASILAALVLGEAISLNLVLGIILILAGVTISVKLGTRQMISTAYSQGD